MRKTVLMVFLMLAILFVVAAAGELLIWPKLPNVPNYHIGLPDSTYGVHPIDREAYGEGYFFLAAFEDGTYTFFNLFITNLGPGSNNTNIDFSISEANGKNHFARTEFSSDNVQTATDHMDVRIGEHRIWGKYPDFQIKASANGYGLDLKYHSTLPGFAINSGRVCYGDPEDFYSNYVIIPRADVQGTIQTPNGKRKVKGRGYADHGVVTMMPHKYSRRWFSLRCFHDKYTLDILEFTVPEEWGGRKVPMIIFGKDGEILYGGADYTLKPSQWQTDAQTGLKWPKHFDFSTDQPGKIKVKGSYSIQKTIDAIDLLSHMSFFERQIARFFAKSFIYRFLVQVKATATYPDGSTESFSAPAVSEVLYIN